MNRRRVALILAALVAAIAVGIFASPAPALAYNGPGGDCLAPPNPTYPDGGVSGWIDPGPDKPVTGDPFVTAAAGQPQPSIYDVYGYAGTSIVSYDPDTLGVTCISSPVMNLVANINQGVSSVLVATSVRMYRVILSPTFGSLFDPIQTIAQKIIGNGLFLPFMGVVLTAAGVWLLWRSERSTVMFSAEKASKTLLIICLGVAATIYTITIGVSADHALGQVVSSASSLAAPNDGKHQPADSLAGSVQTSINYNTWLQATFGSGPTNDKAAAEFGPRLFKAAAFTRTEAKRIEADPAQATALADAKRADYKTVAGEIQVKYPSAYEYVKGDHASTQVGFTGVGVVGALLAAGFLLLALIRFGYAMIIIRLAIGAAPAVALAAAFPTQHYLATAAFKLVWKALANAIYFGVGILIYITAGIGVILSPTLQQPPLVKLLLLGLLTYALIKGAKQFGLIAAEEKALQRAKDARKGEDDRSPNNWGGNEDRSGLDDRPSWEPEESYPMHAETHMRTPAGAAPVRALAGATKTGALLAASAVTGGASGAVAARQVAKTATVAATKRVAGAGARQIGAGGVASAAKQITAGPARAASAARGSVVYHPSRPGVKPPGPSKAAVATRGAYKIHSIPGGKR